MPAGDSSGAFSLMATTARHAITATTARHAITDIKIELDGRFLAWRFSDSEFEQAFLADAFRLAVSQAQARAQMLKALA